MGVGLQIEGVIEKVKVTETAKAMTICFSRKYPYGSVSGAFAKEFKRLLKEKTYNFYKIKPTKVWMNNPNAKVDERVGIVLKN